MKKLLVNISLISMLFAVAISCEKKSDPDPTPQPVPAETPKDPSTYLSQKTWKIVSITRKLSGTNSDEFATYQNCRKDNLFIFGGLSATGIGTFTENDGEVLCAGTNVVTKIVMQTNWRLNAANDTLSIRQENSISYNYYRILQTTDKTFQYVFTGQVGTEPATFTYTLKAQ